MATLGRSGWLGVGIESASGTPVVPADYIPFVASTLIGKHEPIADVAARGLRDEQYFSSTGRKYGQGDITLNLDPKYSGYLFKMLFGQETTATVSGAVTTHTFVPVTTATPVSATFMFDKGAYRENYPYTVVTDLEIDVKNDNKYAEIKASVMSQFPVSTASGTNTTTSGYTLFSFKDLSVQFGATLAAAQGASATKLTSMNIKLSNDTETIYRSGNAQPDSFAQRKFTVNGSYGLLLEGVTERDNYYNLTKQCTIMTFTGAVIAGAYTEKVVITLYNSRIQDLGIETGIDNLFATTSNFVGEYSKADGKTVDVVLQNNKTAAY